MKFFYRSLITAMAVLLISATAFAAQEKQAVNVYDAYAPFMELISITPSNSTTYSPPLRGCIYTTDGDLEVLPMKNGSTSVVVPGIKGQLLPAMIVKVMATSTTASVVCGR